MNGYIKRSAWIAVTLLGWAMMTSLAQAASFDCAKAGTKVEKLICADAALSKLDEELNAAYKTALQDGTQAVSIKQAQKQWIKERNACQDMECLRSAYRSRITELTIKPNTTGEGAPARAVPARAVPRAGQQIAASPGFASRGTYALVMSKIDEMCHHMRQLMNDDSKQFERTYDSHDRFVSGIEEFNAVPWKPARASSENSGQVHYRDIEGALLDLNNDGVQDFVVRYKASLSGMNADDLYMLDSGVAGRASSLTFKELFGSNNQIAMAGWFYDLSAPLAGRTESLWRLSPFIYHGVSYMYMQSLYKKDEAIGGDFVVIAKYGGGKFAVREMTGKMEDICYIKRADVK